MKLVRVAAVLALLTVAVTAVAQQTSLTGKYEGLAKDTNGEVKLSLDLTDQAGKFSGTVTSPRATYNITKGEFTDGVLTLEAQGSGATGKFTLKQNDDMLIGEFTAEGRSGHVEFRKAKSDEISGEWDAAADAEGQPFPFTLTLKLDGEKVTGSSSSQLGTSQISTGVWKDGKLTLVLDSSAGAIGLVATLDGGKLIGDYDYLGQMQGKWVAVRKK